MTIMWCSPCSQFPYIVDDICSSMNKKILTMTLQIMEAMKTEICSSIARIRQRRRDNRTFVTSKTHWTQSKWDFLSFIITTLATSRLRATIWCAWKFSCWDRDQNNHFSTLNSCHSHCQTLSQSELYLRCLHILIPHSTRSFSVSFAWLMCQCFARALREIAIESKSGDNIFLFSVTHFSYLLSSQSLFFNRCKNSFHLTALNSRLLHYLKKVVDIRPTGESVETSWTLRVKFFILKFQSVSHRVLIMGMIDAQGISLGFVFSWCWVEKLGRANWNVLTNLIVQ